MKYNRSAGACVTRVECTCTYSQLLLEALDLGLQRLCVLRLSLTGGVAGVSQLGETTQSLFQSLNICQQLRDLKHDRTNLVIPNPRNKTLTLEAGTPMRQNPFKKKPSKPILFLFDYLLVLGFGLLS